MNRVKRIIQNNFFYINIDLDENIDLLKKYICNYLDLIFNKIFYFKTIPLFFNKNDVTLLTPLKFKYSKKKINCNNSFIKIDSKKIDYDKRIISKILYKKFYKNYDRTYLEHFLHFLKIKYFFKIILDENQEEKLKVKIYFDYYLYISNKKYSFKDVKKNISILYIPVVTDNFFKKFSIITRTSKSDELISSFIDLTEILIKRIEKFYNDFINDNFFNNYKDYKYENLIFDAIKDISLYFPDFLKDKEKIYTLKKLFYYDMTFGDIKYYNHVNDYFLKYQLNNVLKSIFANEYNFFITLRDFSRKIGLFSEFYRYFRKKSFPGNVLRYFINNKIKINEFLFYYPFKERTDRFDTIDKLISNRIYFLKRLFFLNQEDIDYFFGKFYKNISAKEKKKFNNIIEDYLNNNFFPANIPDHLFSMGKSEYLKFIDYFNFILFEEYFLSDNKDKTKIGNKQITDMIIDFKISNFNFIFPTLFFNLLIFENYQDYINLYRSTKIENRRNIFFNELKTYIKENMKNIKGETYISKIIAKYELFNKIKNITDKKTMIYNLLIYDLLSPFIYSSFKEKMIDFVILYNKNKLNKLF